jgi:hypothetical protein
MSKAQRIRVRHAGRSYTVIRDRKGVIGIEALNAVSGVRRARNLNIRSKVTA